METPALMSLSPHNRLISLAKLFVGVREAGGDNCGPLIEMFQKHVDGIARQDPYCMAFVQWACSFVDSEIMPEFPSWPEHRLHKSENCMQVWERSPVSCRRTKPEPGLIAVWQHWKIIKDAAGRVRTQFPTFKGHTGVVIGVPAINLIDTVEANTSGPKGPDGIVRDGDGIFLKRRTLSSEGSMRLVGFIDPWSA